MTQPIPETFCKRWFGCLYPKDDVQEINNAHMERIIAESFKRALNNTSPFYSVGSKNQKGKMVWNWESEKADKLNN